MQRLLRLHHGRRPGALRREPGRTPQPLEPVGDPVLDHRAAGRARPLPRAHARRAALGDRSRARLRRARRGLLHLLDAGARPEVELEAGGDRLRRRAHSMVRFPRRVQSRGARRGGDARRAHLDLDPARGLCAAQRRAFRSRRLDPQRDRPGGDRALRGCCGRALRAAREQRFTRRARHRTSPAAHASAPGSAQCRPAHGAICAPCPKRAAAA
jgi:hypothetical protein